MFKNGTKSSEAASFLRGSRLRLRVKIFMPLCRLRSRINIFTRIFDAAPQQLFFLKSFYFEHQVWHRSCISLRLRLQLKDVAPAALKGCGPSRIERKRLRLH
jgi:hypothetical protein